MSIHDTVIWIFNLAPVWVWVSIYLFGALLVTRISYQRNKVLEDTLEKMMAGYMGLVWPIIAFAIVFFVIPAFAIGYVLFWVATLDLKRR